MSKGLGEERFKQQLLKSHDVVEMTADLLRSCGIETRVAPITRFAKSHNEQHQFSDDGDIWTPAGRLEVKSLGADFTSQLDWPFRNIIIDEVYQIDRHHNQELWAYINWNKQKTHIAWIPSSSRPQWTVQESFDKRYGAKKPFYVAPVTVATFKQITWNHHD